MNRARSYVLISVVVAAITALVANHFLGKSERAALLKSQELESVLETTEKTLLGYTAYTSYLTVGKQALAGQAKLLTASITREEGVTQVVERNVLPGLSSSGTVAIWYKAEYSFGFDLRPDQYDVRPGISGIQVLVKRPALVTTPAVSNLRYQVLSAGLLTDEKTAALKLYEQATIRTKEQGTAMAAEPAVVALCEKGLIEFLRSFLSRQPGVKVVPQISIAYK